jgi:hypothetical protein
LFIVESCCAFLDDGSIADWFGQWKICRLGEPAWMNRKFGHSENLLKNKKPPALWLTDLIKVPRGLELLQ